VDPVRVVLTGGTGFIGRALAAALEARGDRVTIISRGRAPGWDAVGAEVAQADAVVHLAGEPVADRRWTHEHLARVRASRVDTTDRLARAVAAADRKPRVLVSASAVGYYGMRLDDARLDETAPPGDDVLAELAVAWEAAADPARAAGVRVVHPRIGVVLGRDGGALAKMLPAFRWFVGGPIGSGAQWVSWVHMSDTVRALVFAIDDARLSGPVNVSAPEPATMGDLARGVGRAIGRPSAMRVPAAALRLALGEGRARLLLTGQRAVPRRLLEAGFAFEHPRLGEALRDLL
jgi:uncharacterized protein (TIGR01777 family)